MIDQVTFYTHKVSPFCRKAAFAFAEVGASPKEYHIDLANKPAWYTEKVNPTGKIPALTIGADTAPDQPLPESIKLAESTVIVEFIADLYPDSGLLPKDPVGRAKARFFVDAVDHKFLPAWLRFFGKGEDASGDLLAALEYLQGLIPAGAPYATGDSFTIADIGIVPFLVIANVCLKNDCGRWEKGEGPKAYEKAHSPKFDKLWKYLEGIKKRKTFQETFDEELMAELLKKVFNRS